MKVKKNMKKGMAAVLSMSMMLGLLPIMPGSTTIAKAAAAKTIAGLGTGIIADPTAPSARTDEWKGSYVYFGTYNDNAVKYRVLDSNTTVFSADGVTKTMLLDCDSVLWQGSDPSSAFNSGSNKTWSTSAMRTYLNGTFSESSFSTLEQNAIATSTKLSQDGTDGKGNSSLTYVSLNNDKIFFLDSMEASNTSYGYGIPDEKYATDAATYRVKTGYNGNWWLRSKSYSERLGSVGETGDLLCKYSPTSTDVGVSPAFNISLSSVLFTSVVSGTAGETGAEYKLTLLDSSMTIAGNGDAAKSGNTITVPYTISGADAGNATQVSALVLDREYSTDTIDDATVYYYGSLDTDNFTASGTGTFTLPSTLSDKVRGKDYYVYIVAEDVNGEKETDYASTPVEITSIVDIIEIDSVAVTGIETPAAAKTLDTTAECTTTGVNTTTPSVTWTPASANGTAGYNTTYTASVTLSPEDGYGFASDTTATVNGKAASVTKNADGTLSVTYEFAVTNDLLTGITEPSGIPVSNGTAYADICSKLPSQVTITTIGNTVTKADVMWSDESDAYDASKLEEQVITFTGTVTLPAAVEAGDAALTTTCTVTVSRAGAVDAPVADVSAETYTSDQTVALTTNTEGAAIYYTTDGTDPVVNSDGTVTGTQYTGAISVTGTQGKTVTTTIKAIAVKSGMYDSPIATFVYTIAIPHSHNVDTANWVYDAANHWNVCIAENCQEGGYKDNIENHSFNSTSYEWSADYNTCTAERVCVVCGYTDSETVNSISEVTQNKSCENPELTTYTATFANAAFEKQTAEKVQTAEAAGHSLGEWSADSTSATKSRTCSVCGYVQTAAIDNGEVENPEDKQNGNFYTEGIKNSAEEVRNAVLTDEDKAAIKAGKDVNIWVEMTDQSSTVSDSDKTAVSAKLPTNYVVGAYLDINLWKQITGSDAEKVTQIQDGKVKLGFTIPESLRKTGRTYKIIRIHDGETDVLDASVDENYELTFETDRFSTYALVYTDTDSASTTDTTADTGSTTDASASNTLTSATAAKTGDATGMALYLLMLLAGAAGVAGSFAKRRKECNK